MTLLRKPIATKRRSLLGVAVALAVCVAGAANAKAHEPTFDAADRALAQGQCANAVAGFETVAQQRGWSVPLLYDLGRAYACNEEPGRAVLSYERARLLAPRDGEIRSALTAARSAAAVSTPASPWYERVAHVLTISTWSWMAAASLWLGLLALLVPRKRRRVLVASAVALMTASVLSVGAIAVLHGSLSDGILIAKGSTPIRLSPFDSADVESNAREGERVRMLERHGSFVHVRDGEGRSGWLNSSAVEPIVPRRS